MKLLKLESNFRAYPVPEVVEVKEFIRLARRDKGSPGDHNGKKKQRASREFAYIYHMNSHDSPYASYDPDLREEKILEDLFPEDWEWKKDEIVQEAEDKYIELSETSLIRLLDAAQVSINRLTGYFNAVRFVPDPHGGENQHIDEAKDVIDNLRKLKDVVSSFRSLRDEVEKEQSEGTKTRGGVQLNKYNR